MQTEFLAIPPHVPRLADICYLVVCRDGAAAARLRADHLDGHLAHVEQHWTRYVNFGPIREPGGEALVGSVFLVLASSLQEDQTLMDADPYLTCGMYESVEYKEFSNSIGLYIGGKIWESGDAIRHRAAGGPPDNPAKGLTETT